MINCFRCLGVFMKFAVVFFVLFGLLGVSFAGNINLSQYRQYVGLLNKYQNKINWNKAKKLEKLNYKCDFYSVGNDYYILPGCFLENNLPKLSLTQVANSIWPFIKDFSQVYDLNSTGFFYYPAKPRYFVKYDLSGVIWTGKVNKLFLKILALTDTWIKIPKIYLAFNQAKNRSFYVAGKDLSKRNWGRLQNFNVAVSALDNYVLGPSQELFVNKDFANLPWYYIKPWEGKYLFYGWVCGVSTMIFRLALINPYLYVTKRYNHLHRYVNFYSPYLYGDDASLYEYYKILKIKNILDQPILFKTKKIGNEIYFINVVPEKVDKFVFVRKEKIWKLKALVEKIVFNQDGGIWYIQKWISKYIGYSYER